MGLDMYLHTNSKRVCEEVNDQADEWERDFQTPRGIVIQWRKANAIHKWFVDNVQGGKDDCGTYEVEISQLARLHDACKEVLESTRLVESGTYEEFDLKTRQIVQKPLQVLEDDSKARELLPTQSGFFFGGTEYDQWYWMDLVMTKEKLDKLMENLVPSDKCTWAVVHKDEPDWYVEFRYSSSW